MPEPETGGALSFCCFISTLPLCFCQALDYVGRVPVKELMNKRELAVTQIEQFANDTRRSGQVAR